MTVIATNTSALRAQNALNAADKGRSKSMEQLSSGKRINRASDDAAGLSISTKMTMQIRSLQMATRNISDGISLAQVAEGGLGQIADMLQRMRELAIQAASGTVGPKDRKGIQAEMSQLTTKVEDVLKTTEFNGISLFTDTSRGTKAFDGNNDADFNVGGNDAGGIHGYDSSHDGDDDAQDAYNLSSGADIFDANSDPVLSGSPSDSVAGTAHVAFYDGTHAHPADQKGAAGQAVIQIQTGANAGDKIDVNIPALYSPSDDFTLLGADVKLDNGRTRFVGLQNIDLSLDPVANQDVPHSAYGDDTGYGELTHLITVSGYSVLSGSPLVLRDNATGYPVPVWDRPTGYADGDTPLQGLSGGYLDSNNPSHLHPEDPRTLYDKDGNVVATSHTHITDQDGHLDEDPLGYVEYTNSSYKSYDGVRVGALHALGVIDAAIAQVTSARTNLGAFQNRLEAAANMAVNSIANLGEARSRIADADFSEVSVALAKDQVLSQAATAMLAQANTSQQDVLKLIRE